MGDHSAEAQSLSDDRMYIDVLIVGGGPVGLITAFQLARNLSPGHKLRIIEKEPKSSQDDYGRAITLYPRSSEMLDQLGLADSLAQECFACRATASYDMNGNEVHGRGWYFMETMVDTIWNFALVLRQKYQEEIFRQASKKHGVDLESGVELVEMIVDENVLVDSHRITAMLKHRDTGAIETVKCKYLIGADGGRSFVRRAVNIPFEGSSSPDKWVRVDGVIETDLPKPRTYCAIESPTHGNVLWAALDHGATRIGYAFTAERQKAYDVFDEAAAVKEAIASVKPFSLTFKQVDWWTIYVVGQRIAKNFFVQDCVFLAGDACHTHSSGAAQGMNTGIHDAVNLAWKLSAVLNGTAKPALLHSYEAERKPNVQKLIEYDKSISRLMTMQLPEDWTGDPNEDPNVVLGVVMKEAGTFSSGLGIFYASDDVLNARGSFNCSEGLSSVAPGKRIPDVALQKPGTFEATRLHKETPNTGTFYIAVFVGDASSRHTQRQLAEFATHLQKSRLATSLELSCSIIIISKTVGPSAYEILGLSPFGRVFYDREGTAHERFGVADSAVFVLRPDGWCGTATVLEGCAVQELESYFERFMILS